MTMTGTDSYVLISPVRDEERYLSETLASVISQTIRPTRWVIVDDGSSDATPQLVSAAAAQHDWISYVRFDRSGERLPGQGVIAAFNRGVQEVAGVACEFIVKLDCDLRLPPDYFERLIAQFRGDERLGIASGVYLEQREGRWLSIEMPAYHAAGASKFMRKRCFDEIGGFVLHQGWDTLDEIKAQMHGWKTCHFPELQFYHLKCEGTGIGWLRTSMMHGEIFYLTGGNPLFFLVKVLLRMLFGQPPLLSGLFMGAGFIRPLLQQKRRLVSAAEARFYNRLLCARLSGWFATIFTSRIWS